MTLLTIHYDYGGYTMRSLRKLLGLPQKSQSPERKDAIATIKRLSSPPPTPSDTGSKAVTDDKVKFGEAESKSPATASVPPRTEFKSRDTGPKAVTAPKPKVKFGEAEPHDEKGGPCLTKDPGGIILEYLGGQVDISKYTKEEYDTFTLFGKSVSLEAITHQIGTLILAGQRTKALALILENPSSMNHVTVADHPFGWRAEGTPLRLAAAAGDFIMKQMMENLISNEEANAQLSAQFPSDWREKAKARIDCYYRNPAIAFENQIAEAKLPNDLTIPDAMNKCEKIILDYRQSLRPKQDEPVITTGLIVPPDIHEDIRQIFLKNEANLCEWKNHLLWTVGFQSHLGASSAILAQILIGKACYYLVKPEHVVPEALTFGDRTPFFGRDPENPHVGLGGNFVVNYFGAKCTTMEDGAKWARGIVTTRRSRGDPSPKSFFAKISEATASITPELRSSYRPG